MPVTFTVALKEIKLRGGKQGKLEHNGGKSGNGEHWFSLTVNCFVKCICAHPGRIGGFLDFVHCPQF